MIVVSREEVGGEQSADHDQQEQEQPRPDLRRAPRRDVLVFLDDGRTGLLLNAGSPQRSAPERHGAAVIAASKALETQLNL